MLKLTYYNPVFGPIDLEYDRPVVRVGGSEDNDLVLRHPSVQAHECVLVFRGRKLLRLPPGQAISPNTDLQSLTGPEYGPGDQLQIGEVLFIVGHAANTVEIPEAAVPHALADSSVSEPAMSELDTPASGSYFCPHCRVAYQPEQLKPFGLVGRPKRWLCPKCSHVFGTAPEAAQLG